MKESAPVKQQAEPTHDGGRLALYSYGTVGAKSPSYYKVTAELLHRAVPGSAIQVSPKCVHASIPAAVKELVEDISAYFKC